jgi:hypothetical protein
MLRRSSLVECVSVLPGNRCLQNVEFFFLRQYVQPCLLKNPKYTFYTIKSSLKLAYYFFVIWNRHGLECSRIWKLSGNFIKKCRDFLGRDILGTTFIRAESSLIQLSCRSFIRVIVPYEISKVNFRVQTKILVSMSEEI